MRSGLASTWKTLTKNLGLGFQLLASRKRMLYVGTLPMSLKQWDQIVWLFVQYLAIYYFENLHNTANVGSKLWQIINKLSNQIAEYSQNIAKVAKFCNIWSHWPGDKISQSFFFEEFLPKTTNKEKISSGILKCLKFRKAQKTNKDQKRGFNSDNIFVEKNDDLSIWKHTDWAMTA